MEKALTILLLLFLSSCTTGKRTVRKTEIGDLGGGCKIYKLNSQCEYDICDGLIRDSQFIECDKKQVTTTDCIRSGKTTHCEDITK